MQCLIIAEWILVDQLKDLQNTVPVTSKKSPRTGLNNLRSLLRKHYHQISELVHRWFGAFLCRREFKSNYFIYARHFIIHLIGECGRFPPNFGSCH